MEVGAELAEMLEMMDEAQRGEELPQPKRARRPVEVDVGSLQSLEAALAELLEEDEALQEQQEEAESTDSDVIVEYEGDSSAHPAAEPVVVASEAAGAASSDAPHSAADRAATASRATRGAGTFALGGFRYTPKPAAGEFGGYEVSCPHHRKSQRTACAKFSPLLGTASRSEETRCCACTSGHCHSTTLQ